MAKTVKATRAKIGGAKKTGAKKTGAKKPVKAAKSTRPRAKIAKSKTPVLDVRAFGTLFAVHTESIIGGPPTTGTAKETGAKGGDRAPDDAAPDFDSD